MIWPFLLAAAGKGGSHAHADDAADASDDDPRAHGDARKVAGAGDPGVDARSDDATGADAPRTGAPADGTERSQDEGAGAAGAAGRTGDPRDRRRVARPERPPPRALDAQVKEAQRKLREAIEKTQSEPGRRPPQVGQKVDKYFGEKLPPVCERLGCYLTDDGKRFYCVNATCQKHRKRATKHTKVPKKRDRPTYFRCPRCESRHVDLLMFTDQYECRRCGHTWDR